MSDAQPPQPSAIEIDCQLARVRITLPADRVPKGRNLGLDEDAFNGLLAAISDLFKKAKTADRPPPASV